MITFAAPPPPRPKPAALVEAAMRHRPLAVYVIRSQIGEFVQAKVSRTPPADAEVHLRTHDPEEARQIADRLALTLAPVFVDQTEWPNMPHVLRPKR